MIPRHFLCPPFLCDSVRVPARGNKPARWISIRASMTDTLHFSGWINCISAQLKVNLCAPGAPKGPKVGMSVRQYEMLCANDAGALLGNTMHITHARTDAPPSPPSRLSLFGGAQP